MTGSIHLPSVNKYIASDKVGAIARVAMNGLDAWVQDADTALVGLHVVRTGERDPLYGRVGTIERVVVAHGASGYHMFVLAPVKGAENLALAQAAQTKLLEIGVTCELIAPTDA